jgi:hypothetical protein
MYTTWALFGFLVVLAALLVHFKPVTKEGFASYGVGGISQVSSNAGYEGFSAAHAVNPKRMPECVSRSTDAQSLLARFADYPLEDTNAAEMRLLVTKLCCMEADIMAPSAGVYRTMNLQFRTSEDMEPPSTIVGRCLRNAVNKRDIELIIEKYSWRGHQLLKILCTDDLSAATAEFDKVVANLQFAMTSFCLKAQPQMDRPIGARDMGFWEPEEVADLSQYQGVSAVPK